MTDLIAWAEDVQRAFRLEERMGLMVPPPVEDQRPAWSYFPNPKFTAGGQELERARRKGIVRCPS